MDHAMKAWWTSVACATAAAASELQHASAFSVIRLPVRDSAGRLSGGYSGRMWSAVVGGLRLPLGSGEWCTSLSTSSTKYILNTGSVMKPGILAEFMKYLNPHLTASPLLRLTMQAEATERQSMRDIKSKTTSTGFFSNLFRNLVACPYDL